MAKKIKDVFTNKEDIIFLTELGYDIEKQLDEYNSVTESYIIHDAIMAEREDIISILVKEGININQADKNTTPMRHGRTPLLLAISQGHTEIAKFLLDNNVDPEKCDEEGEYPLMLATLLGNKTIFTKLLTFPEININQETPVGKGRMTALMYAAQSGQTSLAKLLIERGAELENSQGKNALDYCFNARVKKHIMDHIELIQQQKNRADISSLAVLKEKLEMVQPVISTPAISINNMASVNQSKEVGTLKESTQKDEKHAEEKKTLVTTTGRGSSPIHLSRTGLLYRQKTPLTPNTTARAKHETTQIKYVWRRK